jgi:hypothetical protein
LLEEIQAIFGRQSTAVITVTGLAVVVVVQAAHPQQS